jgi:uncharacterized protein (TIGR02452 family)
MLRLKRILVAKENHKIVRNSLDKVPETYKYQFKTHKPVNDEKNNIMLTDSTTNSAAVYFTERNLSVTLLNFANTYNPGGGYLQGDPTQEEELCRTSPYLYASLNNKRRVFYPFDWQTTLLYTSDVEFIRSEYKQNVNPMHGLLNTSYKCNIITAAARDLRGVDFAWVNDEEKYNEMLMQNYKTKIESLIENIYFTPFSTKTNVIILGAIGCGAFRPQNNLDSKFEHVYPEFIAKCFKNVLDRCGKIYEYVCFAIPNKESVNYKAFKKVFEL